MEHKYIQSVEHQEPDVLALQEARTLETYEDGASALAGKYTRCVASQL